MRICVYGAGAIGGHLATKLAAAGHDTSVIVRGTHLAAIRAHGGLTLRIGERRLFGPLTASQNAADFGPQDVVIATVKATALPDFADAVGPLLGPDTMVVFVQNGIPWWYANGLSSARPSPPDLSRLDPGGKLAHAIAPERVIGATIYTSNEVVAPGVIENDSATANTLIVGEPDDAQSERVQRLRAALAAADVASPATHDIRATLWRRLLVNIAGSVVSSIIEQPVGPSRADPAIRQLFARLTAEGTAVAAAHGVDVAEGTVPPGAPHEFPPQHKPSIFQDYERRRPMEIEAILKAPLAFARAAGIDAPALEVITALAAHRAAKHGLYQP
ncbi:ketopantoate reductase family protein [Aquabacterium sp. J223]|uniref:ketopantoate reductase family protein n=1 Tax=Aquabacterium sp. J223 TaxID=2898431 RepID=UPI0021AD87B8|nr:2-dehydropantoate 2-reductase [Aquabacterium sp. J223]UUX94002.1 2-dehydropantoate 2-reductase [Aquabacterium sp. J223]